jgi:GNAT superfamily N-acetyltransferase
MPVAIAPASTHDLDDVVPLFAGYQRFYTGTARDEAHNRAFLTRFTDGDVGRLLVARDDGGTAVGFANLYWTFSSTRAEEHVLLNDLYVAEGVRGGGVGRALIEASADLARERGSRSLSWRTALDNRAAQMLYERTGAERSAWFEYELPLQPIPNADG